MEFNYNNNMIGENSSSNYTSFITNIIDGMRDWVRVLDINDNVLYMNKPMKHAFANCPPGKKCYEYIGRLEPCENCISRKAVFNDRAFEKEEQIEDDFFSVMSSPVKNIEGEIIGVVEVLRNITVVKKLQGNLLIQNKKLQDDLEVAHKLQCRLLPHHSPEDKLNFSFIYHPCEHLGGDFIDIFKIDESHTAIYISDVSGHGVSASMLTIFLRSAIDKHNLSPSYVLQKLYTEFNTNDFDPDLYIAMFFAIINVNEKTVTYSNAGLNVPPIVFGPNRLEFLRIPGIPISNWVEKPSYIDNQIHLGKDDKIFFYTDGIIEIKDQDNRQYGEERLLNKLLKSSISPSSTLNSILKDAMSFASLDSVSNAGDDITMALISIK
jgi:sigma-B regulation protein RsbU (phosphoserine phosphatase)